MSESSYVLTLPLKTELWQEYILIKRLEISRYIYNACLGEILRRHNALKKNYTYQCLIKDKESKDRKKKLSELDK